MPDVMLRLTITRHDRTRVREGYQVCKLVIRNGRYRRKKNKREAAYRAFQDQMFLLGQIKKNYRSQKKINTFEPRNSRGIGEEKGIRVG